MALNFNHNFFSKMWFQFFHRTLHRTLKKIFQEQTKNNQLESEVATLRHENYQMKFTKTHRKQDYVWHSNFKNFEPYYHVVNPAVNRYQNSVSLYDHRLYTFTFQLRGRITCYFPSLLRPRNYIYLTSARSSVQNLSFTTRRRDSLFSDCYEK